MTDKEILACPFCGAEGWLFKHSSPYTDEYSVRCENGCCEVGDEYEERALASWNQRHVPDDASMPHSEQVEGWQPIETAPRDGSKFLVTDGNDYDFGSWHRDHVCGELEGHAPFTLWAPLPALTRNVSDKE